MLVVKQQKFMRIGRRIAFQSCLLGTIWGGFVSGWAAGYGTSKEAVVTPPPLPAIHSLKLEPASLTLKDGRDERRVLVLGKSDADTFIDLTAQATFTVQSPMSRSMLQATFVRRLREAPRSWCRPPAGKSNFQ